MIQARTFGALLALGALTALPGCSYFGGGSGGSGQQYGSSAPSTQYTAPASNQTAAAGSMASSVQQPVTKETIRKVQAQLKQDGLYRGRVDGLWGRGSEQAATRFQQQHQLNPTGKIDLPTLQAMNLTGGNDQYGENNGNAGPNGQTGNPQYGETNGNAGPNNGDNGTQAGNNPNYSTGNQNGPGSAHASNMPYENNAGPNGQNGNPNNGPGHNTNQPPAYNGAPQR